MFQTGIPARHGVIETAAFSADGWTVLAEDPTDRFRLARWDIATGMQVGGYAALPGTAQRLRCTHRHSRPDWEHRRPAAGSADRKKLGPIGFSSAEVSVAGFRPTTVAF